MGEEKGTPKESIADILAKKGIEELLEKKIDDFLGNEKENILGDIQRSLINRIFQIFEDHENAFIQFGDYWLIKYHRKMALLKHLKGLSYIAFLLQRPWENVFILDLFDQFQIKETSNNETLQAYKKMKAVRRIEQLEEEGIGAGQILDLTEKARVNVKNQIKRALRSIKNCTDISSLESHLEKTIETGRDLIYKPSPSSPISWFVLTK